MLAVALCQTPKLAEQFLETHKVAFVDFIILFSIDLLFQMSERHKLRRDALSFAFRLGTFEDSECKSMPGKVLPTKGPAQS